MVSQQFATTIGALHLHGLVQIQVEQSGTTVAQYILHQLQGISLQGIGLLGTPSHPYTLGLWTYDGSILGLRKSWQWCKGWLLYISTWLPTAEVLIDDSDGLIRIKITSHTDCHIIGAIPLVEVVLDIGD